MKKFLSQLSSFILAFVGFCACSAPIHDSAELLDRTDRKSGNSYASQVNSPKFISDPNYLPADQPDPLNLYLRVFGRFDNRKSFLEDAPERFTRTKNSIYVEGDGGMLFNERLTVINAVKFQLERDRGGSVLMGEVYCYDGSGWVLEKRDINQ